jgi:hypothetical protein
MKLDQTTRFNGGNHFEPPHSTQRPGRRDYQASNGGITDLTEIRKVEKWGFYMAQFTSGSRFALEDVAANIPFVA